MHFHPARSLFRALMVLFETRHVLMIRFGVRLVALVFFAAALAACGSNGGNDEDPPLPRSVDDAAFTTTESGLKYYDFEEGDGAVAMVGDNVTVHYNGWLASDSTLFDSSVQRGQPFTFQLGAGRVIQGWDEGVDSMRVGGERQLVIPPDLAYGSQGSGPIPPNATLIFEVELLSVDSGS